MDFIAGAAVPAKELNYNRSKENLNPNSTKTQQSAVKKWNPSFNSTTSTTLNKTQIRERNFLEADMNLKRGKMKISTAGLGSEFNNTVGECKGESMKVSGLGFFKNWGITVYGDENELEKDESCMVQNPELEFDDCSGEYRLDDNNGLDRIEEDARDSVPELGNGRVMHFVEAFEKVLSIPKSKDSEEKDEKVIEETNKRKKWALPGLQPQMVPGTQVSEFLLTSESIGLDLRTSSCLDSSVGGFKVSNKTFTGGQRSKRNCAEPLGIFSGRQLKSTSQKASNLRTEQKGISKKEEFFKKAQEMVEGNKKHQIPIAQGLHWTTDKPECVAKPPAKESTRPIDLLLHSDIRAMEGAEFDHQIAEKVRHNEPFTMGSERQHKLTEEQKIGGLGKEFVPKVQSMPCFNGPFIPTISLKPFNLRTEQRGSSKKEEFFKKVQLMVEEEEKQRKPTAQVLPWTTYEPECVVKPLVKQRTRPIDLVLHSDIRAKKRAKFDHQVVQKMSFIEQYKMERERQQKLAEEEEIRRLRKELIPKARLMPYFDRPFIPRRSLKLPTIPREPNFQILTKK